MQVFNFCELFGYLFVSYCMITNRRVIREKPKNTDRFEIEFQWTHINFTWHSKDEYRNAIITKKYIPENNVPAGIKIYKDRMYLALPRVRPGTPVTLGYIHMNSGSAINQLVQPFPSWKMNARQDCSTLQNVQSMEIDTNGVMWVLDGNRFNNLTSCPPKLVLLDLKKKGKVIHSFIFHNEISMRDGGFLNDLVIDESDGGYAYITETSDQDPGLIVYSRFQNRAWKLRDRTMHAEPEAANLVVDNVVSDNLVPIDGIAMDQLKRPGDDRLVYYTPLSGYHIYAISNKVLKNEMLCRGYLWRQFITYIGRKEGQSDGMVMDNQGNLYYGVLSEYGIGKWNNHQLFNSSKIIDMNRQNFIWPDSFSFDSSGYIYVINNGIHKFFNMNNQLSVTNEIKFRILRLYTGTKSYLHP